GHGLLEVARALERDVAAFCVYSADEAATLRAGGVASPLLILGPIEARDLGLAHECRAAITLWSEGAFRRDAARLGRSRGAPFAVHAKVDTGVTRLGLDAERASETIASYCSDPHLDVRGVYTHLAAAEELESAYTLAQLERFDRATAPLERLLSARGVLRHAAASAAALLFPSLRLDLVRAGIATYGIWPSPETRAAMPFDLQLEPALAWMTKLVTVRAVEAGRSVGYGCSFVTERPSTIGVLPIGYAEGLPRALSNAGVALVGGRRVPIVGRVCMNMSFVDVTDVPEARTGSRVTLVGRDGAEAIDANELAAAAGTIGYELVSRLPSEVPRRYLGEKAASASPRSSVPS
ncbi:MAG: alanine racemase, partial [Candidatus Eremiobacteraeota bacterium]|nr:alanine racemase [Candidatus Eremiobacteraeota bacterium]